MKEEAWVGPATCILFLAGTLALGRGRVTWPGRYGADWLTLAMGWAVVCTTSNAALLEGAGFVAFKGRGLEKLVLQVGVFVFAAGFAVACYDALRNEEALMSLRWLRRMILWSLVAPIAVAPLEILRIAGQAPEVSELLHRHLEGDSPED